MKRSGIPITHAALKSCIKSYTGEVVCVVAASYPELGQEPFAVPSRRTDKSDERIRAHVLDMFGKENALACIATLENLGLVDFLVSATAKILKFEFEKRVADYRGISAV